ncbi:hypothetical protein B0T11DRAFT_71384 [Plectosphaerella cucumerina]|uniref:Uncharacterized protein n=1 Tax=Plectosphaerella cucumerina TaxID=40658 RepID=A0A8K0X813_9PEZI|nr:hypothetical protein B0T11DRAFT_71384 [Plectosphaerella cucumerina]
MRDIPPLCLQEQQYPRRWYRPLFLRRGRSFLIAPPRTPSPHAAHRISTRTHAAPDDACQATCGRSRCVLAGSHRQTVDVIRPRWAAGGDLHPPPNQCNKTVQQIGRQQAVCWSFDQVNNERRSQRRTATGTLSAMSQAIADKIDNFGPVTVNFRRQCRTGHAMWRCGMELKPRNVNALIACRLLPAPSCPLYVRQPALLTTDLSGRRGADGRRNGPARHCGCNEGGQCCSKVAAGAAAECCGYDDTPWHTCAQLISSNGTISRCFDGAGIQRPCPGFRVVGAPQSGAAAGDAHGPRPDPIAMQVQRPCPCRDMEIPSWAVCDLKSGRLFHDPDRRGHGMARVIDNGDQDHG